MELFNSHPLHFIITIHLHLFLKSYIFYLLCSYFHVHIHNTLGLSSFYPDVILYLLHVLLWRTVSSYSCICHSMHFHTFYQHISPKVFDCHGFCLITKTFVLAEEYAFTLIYSVGFC